MSAHPIDPFLTVWSSRGGRDGVDLRARVYRALTGDGPWTRDRLRVTLRAVLAFGVDEQQRFDRCFAEFFPRDEAPAWLRTRLAHDLDRDAAREELRGLRAPPDEPALNPDARVITTPTAPVRRPWRRYAVALAVIACVCASAGVAWRFVPRPRPTFVVRKFVTGPAAPSVAPSVAPRVDPGSAVTTAGEPRPQRVLRTTMTPPSLVTARALLAMLLLVSALAWSDVAARAWAARRVRVPALQPPRAPLRDATLAERQLDLRTKHPLTPPFDGAALDRIALRTGFALDLAQPELDVRATVLASARGGGLLDPVYRPGRRTATLALARPRARDPITDAVLDALTRGLRARGVTVTECTELPGEVVADFHLVVLDARSWSARVRDAWRKVPHVAYLEARDPGCWDRAVTKLPFGVRALTDDGVCEALDDARREVAPPPVTDVPDGDPRQRLGEAFALAVACALTCPVDLAAVDALRRAFTPEVGFLAIQRVLALDGVTGGPTGWTFSSALRAWLCDSLPSDAPLRRRVLDWQSQRLHARSAPDGSRAAQVLAMQPLWVALLRGVTTRDAWQRWVTEAERFLGDETLREVFRAQLDALPPPTVTVEVDARMHERLARAGVVPPRARVRHGAVGWSAIVATALGAMTVVGAAAWTLLRVRAPTLSVWSGPWSAVLGRTTGDAHTTRCQGGAALVGYDWVGHATCRPLTAEMTGPASSRVRLGAPQPPRSEWIQPGVSQHTDSRCPDGAIVVGVEGEWAAPPGDHASGLVTQLHLRCASIDRVSAGGVATWSARTTTRQRTGLQGPVPATHTARSSFWADCRPLGFVQAIEFRGGTSFDDARIGVRVQCAAARVTY